MLHASQSILFQISLQTNFSYTLLQNFQFLLSSDIRSEGSIAIVTKFDFDFLMAFDSTSLPQSKNVL